MCHGKCRLVTGLVCGTMPSSLASCSLASEGVIEKKCLPNIDFFDVCMGVVCVLLGFRCMHGAEFVCV